MYTNAGPDPIFKEALDTSPHKAESLRANTLIFIMTPFCHVRPGLPLLLKYEFKPT